MSKVTKKDIHNPCSVNNSANIKLLLAVIGVVMCIIGGTVCFLGNDKGDEEADAPKPVVVIKTKEDADKYLRENSNYSAGALRELDFNSYWPKEYFTINVREKKIFYWKDGDSVAEVEYTRGHYYEYIFNIKFFKDHSAKDAFENFPTDLGKELEGLVEEKYRDAIDKAFKNNEIDEAEKDLSILYNALAGHPGSYIVLGRANEDGDWKRYQPTDFPTYTMPSEKDLIALARKHAANPDSIAKSTSLGESFQALVNSISVKAVSFDYRGDKIWYGDDYSEFRGFMKKYHKLPYDYTTLIGTAACGWVVPDGKEELENAKEYYSNISFIDKNTYNALKNLKWNAPKVEPTTLEWLLVLKKIVYYTGIVFICLGAILLFVVVLPFVVKFFKDRSNKQSIVEEDADDEDDDVDDNKPEKEKKKQFEIVSGGECTEELQKVILRLKKEIAKLKKELKTKEENTNNGLNSAVEEYKNSKEYKNVIEDTEKAAVDKYKKSNDFKRIITNAEAEGERKFKESKQYKNLEIEAKNWRDLTSCTFEEKVITFLDNTHKMIPSFPKLNTLSNIYAEAKAAGKDEKEVIAAILAALDKQEDKQTGLQQVYKELLTSADYGVEVQDRFETCKALAQIYGERKEYKHIVSKGGDLTIWERLAVMLWATECTNELLKLFGKEHITAGVLAKAADIHKEDIMQVFATRIFKQHINDSTATVGALTASRERLMAEKLAEMQSKYNVSMFETRVYRDFVAALDSIHDTLKSR